MSAPQKYRKKPVTIDAIQWDGSAESATPIIDWAISGGARVQWSTETPQRLQIETLEGTMSVDPGEFIIKGVKGEFYPCKPEIFAATYESA